MGGKRRAKDQLTAIGLGLVFCVALPAFVTGIAPMTWIDLQRQGDQVNATAKTCFFFVIPYRTAVLEHVIGVGDRFVAGEVQPHPRSGGRTYRSENEAFLLLRGREQDVEIPVSPASIETATERISNFLAGPQDTAMKMFVVANWKFGVIAGGALSLLTLLFCLGLVLSAASFVLRRMRATSALRQ